ncbi:hypothetical protein CCP3SC15_1770002 [Gammaproteobacteria bacterium]
MTPINTQPILTEAERLAAVGHYRAALALLDTLPSPADDPVRAGLLRGRILAQQGQFDAAIDHWRAVLAIQPDNQEVKQAIELAMNMKDHPSRSILLRANLHLAIQYAVILLLGGIVLVQAIRQGSPSAHNAKVTLAEQNQVILQLQEQQARQSGERLEAVLRHFQEASERQVSVLEKHLEGIEKAMVVTTSSALPSTTASQRESIREVVERLTALEQAIALERESIRALGARQEERITALGMVMGELGTHLSPTATPAPNPSPNAQVPVLPTH